MNRSSIAMMVGIAAVGSAGLAVLQTPAFAEPPAAFAASKASESEQLSSLPPDPWQVGQLMNPEELLKALSKSMAEKPLVFCVGFPVLYEGGHIAGSEFAGPTAKPAGLQKLKQAAESVPRDRQIVLYCGCCPWQDCPNIRPAFRVMQELGFKNVKVLDLPRNLREDWIDKGFPIQKAGDAK